MAGPWSDPTILLGQALRAYLAQFGPDGYDEATFVDFVVARVHQVEGYRLAAWYQQRAAQLEQLFNANSPAEVEELVPDAKFCSCGAGDDADIHASDCPAVAIAYEEDEAL